jgi:hypothetical protein
MPEPAALAAQIANIIRDHPSNWYQGSWLHTDRANVADILAELDGVGGCQTTACVAGWAAILTAPPTAAPHATHNTIFDLDIDGTAAEIKTLARDALGLSDAEAEWLFDGVRNRAEVLGALAEIETGHRPTIPDDDDDF